MKTKKTNWKTEYKKIINRKVKFTDQIYQIMELHIQNVSYKEICEITGIKLRNLQALLLTTDFKKEEAKMRTCMRTRCKKKMLNLANQAVDVIADCLTSETKTSVNLKAAELVLKYSGFEPDKNINVKGEIEHVAMSLEQKKQLLLEKLSNENDEDFIDLNDDEYEINENEEL